MDLWYSDVSARGSNWTLIFSPSVVHPNEEGQGVAYGVHCSRTASLRIDLSGFKLAHMVLSEGGQYHPRLVQMPRQRSNPSVNVIPTAERHNLSTHKAPQL